LNEAGLKDQVTYFGYQLNVHEILKKADVAFTCSRHEAFGRITVEAMMTGCLVVGANCAGTAELIRHGETGLLFDYEPGKWDDLLQKMESALSLPEVSRRMAAAGRADMLLRMTADRNADEVAALYREMM
jgi:glycosyltransferase involved in cell wall biosynthesis